MKASSTCIFIFSVILISCTQLSFAQGVGGQVKLFRASQEFNRGDYQKALALCKEVLVENPNDAAANYKAGECALAMDHFEDALTHFQKAKTANPKVNDDLSYNLGRTYHMLAQIDQALEEFNKFKQSASKSKNEEYETDKYIAQCNVAKELMAKPVDVTIASMGDVINSQYDDKGPSITADGKTFVFTSRRPNGKAGKTVDKEGDFKYYEDIYMSQWDNQTNNWSHAEILKGSANSEGYDACLSISPDGKLIYIYRNNNDDAVGGDIFVSKVQQSGKWGAPKKMEKPINSSYVENGACISADGNTLYFVSERPSYKSQKAFGRGDIWMVKKISRSEWGEPVNLGPTVNTAGDEGGIFLHPDGKTLFFTSEGHNNMGAYDIFMTRLENGVWSTPVNLGYPINTVRKDMSFILTTDNTTAYFASDRPGGMGERDIYKVDMTRYPLMAPGKKQTNTAPSLAILSGKVTAAETGKGIEGVEVVVKDKETQQEVAKTTTNEEGDYFLTLTANKTYNIEAQLQNYQQLKDEVKITADKVGTAKVQKDLQLKK